MARKRGSWPIQTIVWMIIIAIFFGILLYVIATKVVRRFPAP